MARAEQGRKDMTCQETESQGNDLVGTATGVGFLIGVEKQLEDLK